jgi:hypothetical protein
MIDWLPKADMPAAMKDGRELLLCQINYLGTADGGDGTKLNPTAPYLFSIGRWTDHPTLTGYWETQADDDGGPFYLYEADVDFWAEITAPGAA